ncbi:MAG: DUF4249 domain-containing protein, partial [Bacteroidota bacterium]
RYMIAIAVTSIIMACEKVVTINVKSTANAVVVQANITNIDDHQVVKLEHTANYYDSNVFSPITGAKVFLSDNSGFSENLTENANGIYTSINLKGTPGKTYQLRIEYNANVYQSEAQMPFTIPIDSLLIIPRPARFNGQQNGYSVICKFKDPIGLGNYYRVNINSTDTAALNGRNSRILSDKYSDGDEMSVTFRTQLSVNDTVFIQLHAIPKSTYDFFNTLSNAQGEVGAGQFLSSLPANPTNNVSNNAYGYFSAYAVTSNSTVVK